MPVYRKTAVVTFTLPGLSIDERMPLTREREYGVTVRIGERDYPAQNFRSPRNDEEWREYIRRLRDCNTNRNDSGYRGAILIRTFARELYQNLAGLSSSLEAFLREAGVPRRLVIQTRRPELHTLPWGGLYDTDGNFLADGDLSVVQCWENFSALPEPTAERLVLKPILDADTKKVTKVALDSLPEELSKNAAAAEPDILHVEAHGNAVLNEIGETGPWRMAERFGKTKMALLWSCFSAAGNSWGESPALCLNRMSSSFVLSFQAELHNLDAASIAKDFYSDTFGALASRDPESAVVRIRAKRFRDEDFAYAAWASMTLFLRNPLDLSALPLNGPRLPAAGWSADAAGVLWDAVCKAVARLQPGGCLGIEAPASPVLPKELVAAWKGTVIRLDGAQNPLPDDTLKELEIDPKQAPQVHPADRLIWFFDNLARYGAPLIVWTNAAKRHLDFLQQIAPSRKLTFLLLYGAPAGRGVVEMVEENQLAEARAASARLTAESGDECWQAAYMAYARGETTREEAQKCLGNLKSESERMLLSGNFVSRFGVDPSDGRVLGDLDRRQVEEAYYAKSYALAGGNNRDLGRARLGQGYMLYSQGEPGPAEQAYRDATEYLERAQERDSRWHSALGQVLRDRADLLARQPERLKEASALLQRALAMHTYHGRELQVAYAKTTAARIALTACRYAEAMDHALDASNTFERASNWRGWTESALIVLDALAETRETGRMIAIADLAIEKIEKSNLDAGKRKRVQVQFAFRKAKAYWIAGNLQATKEQLRALGDIRDPAMRREIDRLGAFLNC